MRNVSGKFRSKNTEHTFCVQYFVFSILFSEGVEKYSGAGQATDDNIAHARSVLDT